MAGTVSSVTAYGFVLRECDSKAVQRDKREIKEREELALHADEERINKVLKEKPVKVPGKKAPDKKELQGLSRGAMADELFGHLMKEENTTKNAEDEPEK